MSEFVPHPVEQLQTLALVDDQRQFLLKHGCRIEETRLIAQISCPFGTIKTYQNVEGIETGQGKGRLFLLAFPDGVACQEWYFPTGESHLRLVRFWDGEKLHSYITNVLDPRQLTLKEIAQLYGRRWDIELAFLLIKQYLGLHHWWSSQPELIKQQCFAVLIVAQVIQGMRMQMAQEAGVDAFEVSLPLLLEVLPDLLREQQEPVEWITTYGRELGIIRASTRFSLSVPEVVESDLVMPMQELPRERKERYHSYGEEGGKEGKNVTKSKTGGQKRNEARKKEKEEKEKGKEEKKEKGKEEKKEGVFVQKKSLGQENMIIGKEEKIKQGIGKKMGRRRRENSI